MDLVFLTKSLPAQQIGKLTARDYFQTRKQLLLDYPDGLRVRSWELAPGQIVEKAYANPPCNLQQTLLFADYASQGDHRIALDNTSNVQVILGSNDMTFAK